MQEITAEVAEFLREDLKGSFAVHIVTHDRPTDGAQMHANLVCPAGPYFHLEQRKALELLHDAIFRVSRASSLALRGHARSDTGMASDIQFDFSRSPWKLSMNQRHVGLFH